MLRIAQSIIWRFDFYSYKAPSFLLAKMSFFNFNSKKNLRLRVKFQFHKSDSKLCAIYRPFLHASNSKVNGRTVKKRFT